STCRRRSGRESRKSCRPARAGRCRRRRAWRRRCAPVRAFQPRIPCRGIVCQHEPMNRLARERSPYLLQHAANPVDWYPWGDEAFAKARADDKPIFLSIGYSTCHWCHVMEHESFEHSAVATVLNDHFLSIKVDREDRPD